MAMRVIVAFMTAILAAASAYAEPAAPPPTTPPATETPATPPPPQVPDYGFPISAEQAKAVAAGAMTEAKKNNWRIAVAIVGPDGTLIYFEKMDGTQNASFLLATAKARTAALFRRSSKVFVDHFAAGNTAFLTFPDEARPTASEGGLPIVVDGKIVGAFGVSGGTGPQNGTAAASGLTALTPAK